MGTKYYRNFKEYLESCGITVSEELDKNVNNKEFLLEEQRVYQHLAVINEFHRKIMGFTGIVSGRLENCTGKKVEQYKIYIKKLKRDIRRFQLSDELNKFEKLLLAKAPEYLERAENCVKEIYDNGYYELIERSMKRNEVCLGNTAGDNIVSREGIVVKNIKKCCYNMVECDAVYFLSKLKKRGTEVDWYKVAKEFCHIEELNENSEKFILAALSYPMEFMKICDRYRYDKKEWNEDEYKERLMKAIDKDGQSLL